MLENNPYSFNPLTLQALAVSLGIVGVGVFALIREQASRTSVVFFIAACSIGLWLFGFAWMYSAFDFYLAIWWAKAAFAGIACIPAAVYHFSQLFLEEYQRVRKRVFAVWSLGIVFAALSISTDTLFNTLYSYSWGLYPRLRASSIPFLLYFFSVVVLAMQSAFAASRKSAASRAHRTRARMLLSVLALGSLAALDFVPTFGHAWYPFGFAPIFLCLVIAARSVLNSRFKPITPAFASGEILHTMSEALIVLDSDGVIRLVNKATCGLFGSPEQDLVGRRPLEALDGNRALGSRLEAAAGSEPVRQQEIEYRNRDDTPRVLSLSTSIMRNQDGAPVATVCMMSDVTDRKRTEDERETLIARLRTANEKLRTVDRMKSEFVSVVSHELRTPLTTIKAFIELMLMKPDMPDQKRIRFMGLINSETDRLKRLVSDLLDLSRIESGSMKWNISALFIEDVVAVSTVGMKPLFEDKGLRLTTDFRSPLPACAGDHDRLVQVVTNLLSNAVKFTPPGGSIQVAVRHEFNPARQIVVEISDTGVGIPAGDIDGIFEKFYRSGDQLTSAVEGTGLGLAIARQIVEHHGGRIWAESMHGKGSTFTFTLPVSAQERLPLPEARPPVEYRDSAGTC